MLQGAHSFLQASTLSPPKSQSKLRQTQTTMKTSTQNCSNISYTQNNITSQQLEPDKSVVMIFRPSGVQTFLMLPFPFLMVGCCISKTVKIEFLPEKKVAWISEYPGFFRCLRRESEIEFKDVVGLKMMVAFNYRVDKRQAYRLYLHTKIGEFELTNPRNRQQTMNSKTTLEEIMRSLDIGVDKVQK